MFLCPATCCLAKRRRLQIESEERIRRRVLKTAQQCDDVLAITVPNIATFTKAFRLAFLECAKNPERWASYSVMVSNLEQKYGARSICGWLHGPIQVWTAPIDENWEPKRTPDIEDIRDIHEYALQTKANSRRCNDAVDAWKRWFYPLKHFYYQYHELDDDADVDFEVGKSLYPNDH
jgi:hypothetical protein